MDGKDAESLRIDFALRGVHLPAGEHQVVYPYRSDWIHKGVLVTGAPGRGSPPGRRLPFPREAPRRRRRPGTAGLEAVRPSPSVPWGAVATLLGEGSPGSP